MAISTSKFQSFLEAAINKTKSKVLLWKQASEKKIHLNDSYDSLRSFVCSFSSGRLLLAFSLEDGKPHCFISPEGHLPFQEVRPQGGDEESEGLLLRLYNLVYSQFPSIESFMDDMINLSEDPNDLPF